MIPSKLLGPVIEVGDHGPRLRFHQQRSGAGSEESLFDDSFHDLLLKLNVDVAVVHRERRISVLSLAGMLRERTPLVLSGKWAFGLPKWISLLDPSLGATWQLVKRRRSRRHFSFRQLLLPNSETCRRVWARIDEPPTQKRDLRYPGYPIR